MDIEALKNTAAIEPSGLAADYWEQAGIARDLPQAGLGTAMHLLPGYVKRC
jgi:hypothetical protein